MKSNVNQQVLGICVALTAALLLGSAPVRAAAPDLTVSLTDGLTTINPGATMLYTVTVKNNGTAAATGVKVSANIPSNTYFNGSTNGGTVQSGNVVFPTFTLNAGSTVNLQFDLGLNSSIPAGSANTISVTASAYDDGTHGADLNLADNCASDNDTINGVAVANVDLSIDITDGLNSIQAGNTMLYTLTVKNLGNVDSNNVLVRALLPANVTFISADNNGTVQNGYVVYPLFSLKTGVTTFRTFTLSLNNPLPTPAPSTLSVSAYVSNDQSDCNTANNCATDCDTILPGVDLSITVTDNQSCATPGTKLTYTITGCNVYTTNATGVFIQAYLPAGVTFFSASNSGTISGSTVNWNIGALNAGACVTRTLVVTVNSPLAANITSLVMNVLIGDDGTHGCDINTADDTACDTDTICIAPDLQITQDSATKCFLPGDTITYTLAVVDNVAIALTGVVVTDTIPANTTYVSSSNGGTFSGGVVTFPSFSLASGTTTLRTVTVSLNANVAAGTTLTNTASVTDDHTHGADTNTANNTAVRGDCTTTGPDVSIIKSASTNSCKVVGSTFTYTLTISTLNSVAVTGVVVSDTLPAGLNFVAASNGGSITNGTVTYPAFSLGAFSTTTRTLTVQVSPNIAAGTTSITNTATVTDDHTHGTDVNLTNNTSNRTDCIVFPPDLQITQDSAGKCFVAGDTITYNLAVKNNQGGALTGVVVTDTLPSGVTFVSATNGGTVSNGVVTFPAFALAANTTAVRTIIVTLNANVAAGTTLTNTASVTDDGANGADTNTANNTAIRGDCTSTSGPDVSIIKTADINSCKLVGSTFTYTLTISTLNSVAVTGVVVSDTLPAGLNFVGASNGGTFANGTVTYPAFSLGAFSTTTRTLTVQVSPNIAAGTTSITNTATVTDDHTHGTDVNLTNNTSNRTDCIVFPPDLQITQDSAGKCFVPGDTITYNLAVKNNQGGALTGVVVSDTLPSGVSFVSATNGGTFSNGVVTFPAFSLAATTTAIRTIVVTLNANVAAGTTLTNTASVTDDGANGPDTNTANNTAVRGDCTSTGPDVSIIKTADTNSCKLVGSTFTYTLTISTLNSVAVTGVVVSDTLPAGLNFVGASNGGTFANGTVTYPAFSLGAFSTTTRTLTVQVSPNIAAGTTSITNTATVTDDHTHGTDVNLTNNTSNRTDCIVFPPDLQITQDSAGKCFVPGDTITYNLAVKNNQGGALTGVVVSDTLPSGVTFVSATNGGTVSNGVVTFPAFALAANTTAIRTIVVTLNANVVAGTTLTNTASVTDDGANGADSNTANNTAIRGDCTSMGPDVSIIKTADINSCKLVGSTYSYTLTVSTLNSVAVTGVVVSDTLPAGLNFVSASNGGTFANGTVTYPAFALGAFSTVTRTLTVQVSPNIAAGTASITNTATVTDDHTHGTDVNLTNNTSNRTDCIVFPPDLQITQDAAGKCFVAGDQITYNLAVKNNQGGALTGVIITDTIPTGTTFVSATNGGTFTNGVVTFPAFTLAANTTAIRTVIVSMNANVAAGTTLTNTASVTDDGANGADTNTANNTAVRGDCTQLAGPDVSIVKSATDDCKVPGTPFTYTLTISTLNSIGVTGVLVSDALPAGLNFISASNGGSISNGTVTYPLFSLAGNSTTTRTMVVALTNPLLAGMTSISNTATVTDDHTHGADINTTNNTFTRVDCIVLPPDLQITQDAAGRCFGPADQITYTLSVKNLTGQADTGVLVTDTIPANTTYISSSNGGTFAAGKVTFPAFALPANTTILRTVVVQVNAGVVAGQTLSNTAAVTDDGSHGIDTNTANNTVIRGDCTQTSGPDVAIVKTADLDGCKVRGTQFSYTLTISTLNPVAVTGVVVVDTLPAGLSFVSASDGGTAVGNVVTYPAFALAGNSSTTRHLTVLVASNLPAATANVTNTATVSDDGTHGPDTNLTNNTSIRTDCIVPPPDLQITQDSSPVCFAVGAQITYTLAVKNLVAGGDTGVAISDTLATGVTFVSASNGGTFASGVVTFPAVNLAAGITLIRTITVSVNSDADGLLVNTAAVTDDGKSGADTNTANNTSVRTDCFTTSTPPCTTPPSIISGPSASPVPVVAGVAETFIVTTSDNGTGNPVTVTWDFGDGTPTATGSVVLHTYAAAGSYTIKVTATNACGAVGATLQAATLQKPNPFVCNLLRAPLNMRKTNADSLLFVAQITPAAGFTPAGKSVSFNFSNYSFNATLNSKGVFKDATHVVTLKQFGSSQLVTLKVTKASLKTQLAPGVSADSQAATLPGQRYLIALGAETFGQNLDINFSADGVKGIIFK